MSGRRATPARARRADAVERLVDQPVGRRIWRHTTPVTTSDSTYGAKNSSAQQRPARQALVEQQREAERERSCSTSESTTMIAVVPQRAAEHVVVEARAGSCRARRSRRAARARSSRRGCSRSPARSARRPAARRAPARARGTARSVGPAAAGRARGRAGRRAGAVDRARRSPRRPAGAGRCAQPPWRHPRSSAGDVLGRGLARRRAAATASLTACADRRRVGLVEVELDERRPWRGPSSTAFMFGSVTDASVPFVTGRMPLLAPGLGWRRRW